MKRCRAFLLATALTLGIGTASLASAEGAPLTQTTFMAPASFDGRHPSVMGIYPGMGSAEAIATLAGLKDIVGLTEVRSRLGSGLRGYEPYLAFTHAWGNPANQVNVYFTSPASGNEVFAITRRQVFADLSTRPDFDATLFSLQEEFGRNALIADSPAQTKALLRTGRTTVLSWFLGGSGLCRASGATPLAREVSKLCDTPQHMTGNDANEMITDPARIDAYRMAADLGSDVIVVATVRNDGEGRPVTSVTLSLFDVTRRLVAAEADAAALAELLSEGRGRTDTIPSP